MTAYRYSVMTGLLAVFFLSQPLSAVAQTESKADSLVKAKKHFSFAVQYKNSGSLEQAVENYRQSIAYNDTVYQVHYSFADLLMKMEKPVEARREFALALALNPDHYNSATMLAKLYYDAAEYDSALTVYNTMLRLKPDDTSLLGSIAALREYLGKKEDALNAYRELIRRGDNTKDTFVKAATLASSLEQWDTADSLITTALADKTLDVDIIRLASSISLGKKDGATAIERLKKLTEIAPSDETAIAALEKTARAERDTASLIWALELRIGLTPDNADTVGELSELLLHEGKREKARDCLKNGIVYSPNSGKLHILMGNLYREQGDTKSAIAEYEKALSDNAWKSSAQQFIWQIRPPKTEDEKAEQEFFNRAKKDSSSQ